MNDRVPIPDSGIRPQFRTIVKEDSFDSVKTLPFELVKNQALLDPYNPFPDESLCVHISVSLLLTSRAGEP